MWHCPARVLAMAILKSAISSVVLRLIFVLVLGSCAAVGLQAAHPTTKNGLPATQIYDSDPEHVWNRLYSALYARIDRDGNVYHLDELDPALWPSSTYLLSDVRHSLIGDLLKEFLSTDGQSLIRDPVKR